MAAFSTDDVLGNRLDFEIARDGFVSGLRRNTDEHTALAWLRSEGYQVIEMDAGNWREKRQMLATFASALSFPDYFGMNLDALNDCMSDVAEGTYGLDPTRTGLVLVLRDFERFARRLSKIADSTVDILQQQGRYGALFGNRLLTILA